MSWKCYQIISVSTCVSFLFLWHLHHELVQVYAVSGATTSEPLRNRNVLAVALRDLVPLTCNANITQASCQNWTAKFGTNTTYATRVFVPCGECVRMDRAGNITFNDGLDIVGKLVFPDGYRVNVSSTLIVVQGLMDIKATGEVSGMPYIQFTMIGNNASTVFTPVNANANVCGVNTSTCSTGKKGIVVAGGNINRTSIKCQSNKNHPCSLTPIFPPK